jgi:quinol monooxygenase YgiN
VGVIRLTGQLTCADEGQTAIVAAHLPEHIRLTRAEPGCLSFEVRQSADPLVLDVAEVFSSRAAFEAHQARAAASAWGQATKGIERRYVITED